MFALKYLTGVEDILSSLGRTIKAARQAANFTQDGLAERIGITGRYVMALENEGKQPSFEVLVKLIHTLALSPEQIFYPANENTENEKELLIRLLALCDERESSVVLAAVKALVESK